jgi:hypothetical protein
VSDPDEPNLTAERDLEWAAVDHPRSASGPVVRHTLKTRARYERPPFLYIRTPDGVTHKITARGVLSPGRHTPLVRTETPAGAPDTVSYAFLLSQIGDPRYYHWRAVSAGFPDRDRLPDSGWVKHRIDTPFPAGQAATMATGAPPREAEVHVAGARLPPTGAALVPGQRKPQGAAEAH